jgi:hypothetical protein
MHVARFRSKNTEAEEDAKGKGRIDDTTDISNINRPLRVGDIQRYKYLLCE